MAIYEVNEDNKIVVGLLVFFLALSILLFVVYPPLRNATGIYGFLAVISLGIYTNPAFQEYLYGIAKSTKTFMWIFAGVGVGLVFMILPKVGLSMGVPILPASVSENIRFVIIVALAPVIEDILRFAFLGMMLYMMSKKGISSGEKYLAITIQAIFFTLLHLLSYAGNFYEAPTWLGALVGINAISASLIAAFIFAWATGFFVSRDGVKNIALAIAAHLTINLILFTKLAVVGLSVIFGG